MSMSVSRTSAGRRGLAEDVLEQRAAFLLGAIANKLVNVGGAISRRHFGIGFTEWRALVMLALEPAAAKRICEVVGLDKAAISRALSSLEAQGLIRPTEATAGRRSRAYELTDAGAAIYRRMLIASREQERRLLAGLQPGEVPVLLDMLRRVLAQIPEVEAFAPDHL